MSKKLAIKGHPTRGKEVMELLEMMGGKNSNGFICSSPNRFYYILNEYFCLDYIDSEEINKYVIFTLEEFLEKYPYKVGDKVIDIADGDSGIITAMKWDEDISDMKYRIAFDNGDMGWFTIDTFEFLKKDKNLEKEKNMKKKLAIKGHQTRGKEVINENKCAQCVYAVNNDHCGLRGFRSNFNVNYCSAQNVDKLPNGFELQEDGYFSWVNKKPKYPATFEECLNLLYCKSVLRHIIGHKAELLLNLEKLLICRDAYWKIYGEEMGLGKPWEPDWDHINRKFYCIYNSRNNIVRNVIYSENKILAFPTEEMRDAFYENFKDLIKQCKELL